MTNIEDVKKVELEILGVIMTTLDKENIHPFLIAGSLLGAVRHNGFIPWDDDIDIGLMRDDYEKASKILKENLPKGYTYCDYKSEDEYPYNFAKVRKDSTSFVHGGDEHLKIHQGIYVDIFPFDKCPNDFKKFRSLMKKIKRMRLKIDLYYMNYRKYGKIRPIYQLPFILAGHLFVKGKQLQKKMDDIIYKQNQTQSQSNRVTIFTGGYYEREWDKIKWFSELITFDFLGIKTFIPKGYHEYLTNLYGDYMKLPSEEERESHHDVVYISTDKAYCGGIYK